MHAFSTSTMHESKITDTGKFSMRLYIAAGTPASERAKFNLMNACEKHLKGKYTVEVIDIFKDPIRAMSEGVLITPTMVRLKPLPICKIIGDLSDGSILLYALGVKEVV